jgi:hypothetical protein
VANRGEPERPVDQATFWLERAAEARTIAQHLSLPESKLARVETRPSRNSQCCISLRLTSAYPNTFGIVLTKPTK